ncbi:EF-hand domain-containing protein [Roseococcus sp. DSY-14]|uniref:EF-hand domain-containing protein n=1 Tax=Roseococcus sp. DSY-14 TaxID=3369650 RepID=UPI00387B2C4E
MTKTKAFLAMGAALLAAAPVLAQPAAPAPQGAGPGAQATGPRGGLERMFERLDANRDGRVAWDEAWAVAQERFGAADADRNGSLSFAEFGNLRAPGRDGAAAQPGPRPEHLQRGSERRAAMFRALDANSDGNLTLAEMQAPLSARFRAMDANGDGAVDRAELPRMGRHGGGYRHGHGLHHGGPHHGGPRGDAPAR